MQARDWDEVAADLDARGHAVIPALLSPSDCAAVAALYEQPDLFRSQVVMQRHGVGEVRSGRRRTLGIIFHDAA